MPPNLLLIWPDQQRNDTLPCHGNKVIKAPNLDRLCSESVVFSRAYCTEPVCTPSRASILTGLWPHQHGCVNNNIPLRRETRTLAEMIPSDYRRAYYGKWHLGDELRAQHGFEDWISIEDGIYRKYYSDPEDLNRRSSYHEFLIREGFPPDSESSHDGVPVFSRNFAAGLAERYTKASFLAGEAERFLGEQTGDQPFFLSVNFLEPHPPYFGPLNYLYDPDDVETGPAFTVPPAEDASKRARRTYEQIRKEGCKRHPLETETDWRRFRANYYGLVTLVDNAVGRILAALEASGQADNTIIAFTSDHGEFAGDHAMVQKGLFYDEASRIPLIIRAPGARPRMVDEPISLIDLAPTLLDLMGQPAPDELPGKARTDVVRGADMPREDVMVTWNNDESFPEERGRCIVTPDGWKLNLYAGDQPELYNLNEDPAELKNLANDPTQSPRITDLATRIKTWQKETGDTLDVIV